MNFMNYWDNKEKNNETVNVNIKVEYESIPIRHMVVQCPYCNNWSMEPEIVIDDCRYSYQILGSHCCCPKCEKEFNIGMDSKIEQDVSFPEFYDIMNKENDNQNGDL